MEYKITYGKRANEFHSRINDTSRKIWWGNKKHDSTNGNNYQAWWIFYNRRFIERVEGKEWTRVQY